MKSSFVYILTNMRNGTLYIGVTSDICKRIWEHKEKKIEGFTKTYGLDRLVYFEVFENIERAIRREKQLKEWKRIWKLDLIEQKNPLWNDLYDEVKEIV